MKSNTLLYCLRICVIFAWCATGLAGMENSDVIKMVGADLSEDTIILAINNDKEPRFDTSATALIELKEYGVSEDIIQAMIGDDGGSSSSSSTSGLTFNDVDSTKVMPPQMQPEVGNSYYTRINFWYEGNKSIATNYSRGILVPINTEVKLLKIGKKDFRIELPGGNEIRIENVEKYTGATVAELASRYLAGEKAKIDLYGEEMAQQIRSGEMRLGMNKDQVLMTRGYPPLHETPGLESDRWVYWSSRFVKLTIVFQDGILAQGRGLL